MKSNVGGLDRLLRIAAGVVLLVTGLFRFCPVYGLIGLNTCPLSGASTK